MRHRFPDLNESQKKFIRDNHSRMAIYKIAKFQATCPKKVKDFMDQENLSYRKLSPHIKKIGTQIRQEIFNSSHPGYWLIG